VLTGGQAISEDLGIKWRTSRSPCSSRKKVMIDKENTPSSAAPQESDIEAPSTRFKAQIAETTRTNDVRKLQERLAKLAGGVAVNPRRRVTEVEVRERKDRLMTRCMRPVRR